MTYAIIRGNNGRRHEVDFGDSPVRVEVYASEETVEIFVEADSETLPEERRRFALINVPRDQFSHATGEAATRDFRRGGCGSRHGKPHVDFVDGRPDEVTRRSVGAAASSAERASANLPSASRIASDIAAALRPVA